MNYKEKITRKFKKYDAVVMVKTLKHFSVIFYLSKLKWSKITATN